LPQDTRDNRLSVKVTPNAGRSEITGWNQGVLEVRVAAPPVAGRANRELTVLLGKLLGVSRSSIGIVSGLTSRRKVIEVAGLTRQEILRRLSL
jgi:uncharacterized protein (TIGR00251 family)